MKRTTFATLAAAATLWASAALYGADAAPAPDYQAIVKYEFGQSRRSLAEIEAAIRQAKPEQYGEMEASLLSALRAPGTTVDAKRYICRYLSIVGSKASVPALAELLADERLNHAARFALEVLPDASAAAALRDSLGSLKGKQLIGVIMSLGARRDAQAVGALTPLMSGADADVASAAITSMGLIGTADAARALAELKPNEGLKRTVLKAQVDCAERLVIAGRTADAVAILKAVSASDYQAARIGALRGMIAAQSREEAVKAIVQTLSGNDPGLAQAALAVFRRHPDSQLRAAVAAQVGSMTRDAEVSIIGMLHDFSGDLPVREILLKAIAQSKDEPVRTVAIESLANYAEAADVPMLIKLLAGGSNAEKSAARHALERNGRTGVDEALVAAAQNGDSAVRVAVLQLLTSRQTQAGLPIMTRLVADTDAAVATQAIRSLGQVGSVQQLGALADVLVSTADGSIRSAAEESMKTIAGRASDKGAASKVTLAAMERAGNSAAKVALIRVLVRIGDGSSLAAVQANMGSADKEVAEAATRALTEWPTVAAAEPLLALARNSQNPTHQILAIRGYIRLAGIKEQPTAQRLSMYRNAMETAQRAEEKKAAIAGLADLPAPEALDLAAAQAGNRELSAEATSAVIKLARQLAAAYNDQAKAALEKVKATAATDDLKRQAEDALADMDRSSPEGFILAWMVAGPFTDGDKDGTALFDVAFGPEKPDAKVEWRPAVAAPNAQKPGLIDLARILGPGNNRVGYLRTTLVCERATPAILEIGSDDGFKVWLNGQKVAENNAVRPASPNQDRARLSLRPGANTLLVKITQGGGEWEAYLRLRSRDGGRAAGVRIKPE